MIIRIVLELSTKTNQHPLCRFSTINKVQWLLKTSNIWNEFYKITLQRQNISLLDRKRTFSIDLPNAHTSDLLLNFVKSRTSGAAHLTGNLVPSDAVYSSSMTYLETHKSQFSKLPRDKLDFCFKIWQICWKWKVFCL